MGNGVSDDVGVIAGAEVFVADGMSVAVGMGDGEAVGINCVVAVGQAVSVKVAVIVDEAVDDGKINVEPGFGVLVATLGTHNRCPL